jgi:hypothetical protein
MKGNEIAETMRAILEETRAGFKHVNEVVNDVVEKKNGPDEKSDQRFGIKDI